MSAMIISATLRFAAVPERMAGILVLLFVAAILGFSNTVQKLVLADSDPWVVMGLRATIAVAVLLPLATGEWLKFTRQQTSPPPVLWLVIASFAFGMGLQNIGANYTTASNLGFLINAYVIFMPLLVWLTGRGRPTLLAIFASLICFAGAGLLSSGTLSSLSYGDMLCLGAALAYSVWVLAMSQLGPAASLVTSLTCLQWIPVAVLGLAGTDKGWVEVGIHLQDNLGAYVVLGVFASAFAYVLAAFAQQKISACCASVIYAMEGVFGVLAAYIGLGERLGVTATLGAALIVCSIVTVANARGSGTP
jgi:drug/metabolite transporter (DMT)-like permease